MLNQLPRERIADFCRQHRVHRASVFGSALAKGLSDANDIDILVEFEPGKTPGLAFFAMQDELSHILGGKVDLQTPDFLSKLFRANVLQHTKTIYHAPG